MIKSFRGDDTTKKFREKLEKETGTETERNDDKDRSTYILKLRNYKEEERFSNREIGNWTE